MIFAHFLVGDNHGLYVTADADAPLPSPPAYTTTVTMETASAATAADAPPSTTSSVGGLACERRIALAFAVAVVTA